MNTIRPVVFQWATCTDFSSDTSETSEKISEQLQHKYEKACPVPKEPAGLFRQILCSAGTTTSFHLSIIKATHLHSTCTLCTVDRWLSREWVYSTTSWLAHDTNTDKFMSTPDNPLNRLLESTASVKQARKSKKLLWMVSMTALVRKVMKITMSSSNRRLLFWSQWIGQPYGAVNLICLANKQLCERIKTRAALILLSHDSNKTRCHTHSAHSN